MKTNVTKVWNSEKAKTVLKDLQDYCKSRTTCLGCKYVDENGFVKCTLFEQLKES